MTRFSLTPRQHTRALLATLTCSGLLLAACQGRPAAEPSSDQVRITAATAAMEEADAAYKSKRYDDAINGYSAAIRSYNDLPMAWNNMGKAYLQRNQSGDKLAAANCFKTAGDLDRVDWRPVANVGAIYHELGYFEDAANWYAQALERDPNAWLPLVNSILVDQLRDVRSEETADRIRRALFLTDDPQWRDYLKRQKELVEGRLAEARRSTPSR